MHKMDFFAYIFCGKTNKNILSKLSAQKIVNTLSSLVVSWRGKKDIQRNPKACETLCVFNFHDFDIGHTVSQTIGNLHRFFLTCNPL